MQAGVFWGYIGLIDGLVRQIQKEDGRDFTVIGTGGVASLFDGASETIMHYDSKLTIDGLYEQKREDEFVFLPLGGSGEIGMNLNLFGFGPEHDRKWIIVDMGVTFGGADTPGIDIIMPDINFIEQNRHNVLGIILTHAHEDHMGALARLWDRIRCPVWATMSRSISCSLVAR